MQERGPDLSPSQAAYLDLLKRCIVGAIGDRSTTGFAKSAFLRAGDHPELLRELVMSGQRKALVRFYRRMTDAIRPFAPAGSVPCAALDALDAVLAEPAPTAEQYDDHVARLRDGLKRTQLATDLITDPAFPAAWEAYRTAARVEDLGGDVYSMSDLSTFDNVEHCLGRVLEDRVPGDVIETGVWRGGISIFMRGMLRAFGDTTRTVWVADSFQGLPPAEELKGELDRAATKVGHIVAMNQYAVTVDEVRTNFHRFGLMDERVRFLVGWFKDTLPTAPIEQLSVLRLDGDFYESVMDPLEHLYPKLSVGGYVIADDYGLKGMNGYQAVDDFRARHGIRDPLVRANRQVYYWRRTA